VEVVNPPLTAPFAVPVLEVTVRLSFAIAGVAPKMVATRAKTSAAADDLLNMVLPKTFYQDMVL
jgi:hypothetical protein